MKKKKKKTSFTVTYPPIIICLSLVLIAFFVTLTVLYTIFSDPHPLLYICTIVIVFIPCTSVFLWAKLFKVTVNGNRITVRRHNGFKYSFDVSEIVRVDRKIVETGMGANEIITIRTNSRHFKVETLMRGSDKMLEYILENVNSRKIHINRRISRK